MPFAASGLQLLGAYLPGPLNVVKDVLLSKSSDEPQVRCASIHKHLVGSVCQIS